MDLILVNPGNERDIPCEHIGLASLKSYCDLQGFQTDLLDMALENIDIHTASQILIASNPAIIGITMLDRTKYRGLSLIRSLRTMGYKGKIICGGYFPTFHAEELLREIPQIDLIGRGEGERTLLELMTCLLDKQICPFEVIKGISFRQNGQIMHNMPRPLIKDLDRLPAPDRKYARKVLQKGGHLRVSASRGCWGNCSFCDINSFYTASPGKKWRSRSMINFVNELEELYKRFNCNYFILNDDNFMTRGVHNIRRAESLKNELDARNLVLRFELMGRVDSMDKYALSALKEAGLKRMFLGIESFDQAHLHRFNKGTTVRQNLKAIIRLKKMKIDCIISVILADAHTRLSDLIGQFIFLYWISKRYFNSRYSKISINERLEIYRGSRLYTQYKKENLLTGDHWLKGYHYRLKFLTALRLRLVLIEKYIMNHIIEFYGNLKKVKTVFHTILYD